ncbi:MAG: hypothetical protein ACYCPQ_10525 [Elusimicrobiota bacterium]
MNWEEKKYEALVGAGVEAIKRTRQCFGVVCVAGFVLVSAQFNAYLPWMRRALDQADDGMGVSQNVETTYSGMPYHQTRITPETVPPSDSPNYTEVSAPAHGVKTNTTTTTDEQTDLSHKHIIKFLTGGFHSVSVPLFGISFDD